MPLICLASSEASVDRGEGRTVAAVGAHGARETGAREDLKGGRRESPRDTEKDGESFRAKGTPRCAESPAGGGQFAAPFFPLPVPSSSLQGPLVSSFPPSLSLHQTLGRENSLFLRFASLRRFFISRLISCFFLPPFSPPPPSLFLSYIHFLSDFLYLSNPRLFFFFFFALHREFPSARSDFFFSSGTRDVIAPHATCELRLTRFAPGTDRVNFLARLSCTYH